MAQFLNGLNREIVKWNEGRETLCKVGRYAKCGYESRETIVEEVENWIFIGFLKF